MTCYQFFDCRTTAWIWDCPKCFRTSGHPTPALGYADIGFVCGVMVGLVINSFHQLQFTRTDLRLHDGSSYKFQKALTPWPSNSLCSRPQVPDSSRFRAEGPRGYAGGHCHKAMCWKCCGKCMHQRLWFQHFFVLDSFCKVKSVRWQVFA